MYISYSQNCLELSSYGFNLFHPFHCSIMWTAPTLFRIAFSATFSALLFSSVHSRHVALFILGDSLNDAGTNNYINTTSDFRANFPPYGETFFRFPTGRFTNGRLIIDFIAEYANLPLIPPYLQLRRREFPGGANFASGGGGALASTYKGFVVSLEAQLKQLWKLEKSLRMGIGDEEGKKVIAEGVYVISIGGNDYLDPILHNPALFQTLSLEEYVGMVIGNVTAVLEGMYKIGARKFGMIGVGPIGCLPYTKAQLPGNNGSCSGAATKLARFHNAALLSTLANLQARLHGFKYSYFDFYTLASQMMNHPSKYGFKESKIACCGSGPDRGINSCGGMRSVKEYELCKDPKEYMFFDCVHPSEAANRQLAKQFWSGNSDVTWPCNLETFFSISG